MTRTSRLTGRLKRTSSSGFSLVEVVLALAVIALGMVAILGLLPSGIDASRTVSDETLVTQIVSDLLSERRTTPFGQDLPALCAGCNQMPRLDANTSSPIYLYFDANGDPVSAATDAYFRLTPTVMNHPDAPFSSASDIKRVVITAEWPMNPATGTPGAGVTRRVFVSEFVRIP